MNKHDSIQPDHGKHVTCAGRNTRSSLSIVLCWVVPPWQVSALGGTWHDPLASLQLALREDVEETDNQLWNLSGILVPHLNITLFPIQDVHVLHIHRGPSQIFSSLLCRTPTSNPIFFFCVKTGGKNIRRLKSFPPNSHPQNLWWKSYCGSWLLKVVHLLADQRVWRLGICCHHECQASRLHFGFLCHLASPVFRERPWEQQDPVGNGGNHAGRLGRVDEFDGKVDRCLPLLSTVSQLLLRWNNPEIVFIQTGVKDIVIFNALLFPSVSIFS